MKSFFYYCYFLVAWNATTALCQSGSDLVEDKDNENNKVPEWAQPSTDSGLEKDVEIRDQDQSLSEEAEKLGNPGNRSVRQFHEVLNELLIEFGYDVQHGQLNPYKNLAIRKVEINETLPDSYEHYVENLVTERIKEYSSVRVINCLPCKTKTSSLINGRVFISSPKTNVSRLNAVIEELGVQYFVDVALLYHTSHMVLAFQIYEAKSKELFWSKTYNSETIRSKFQKLAVDYKQVEKSRNKENYDPEYKFLIGTGIAKLRNIGSNRLEDQMIMLNFRGSERFNNRSQEFGLLLSIYRISPSVKVAKTTLAEGEEPTQPEAFTTAGGLFAMYAHNFFGLVESYNSVRFGMHIGLGPIVAKNYFTSGAKLGMDVYFGRRWTVSIGGNYSAKAKVAFKNKIFDTEGGSGYELLFQLNF